MTGKFRPCFSLGIQHMVIYQETGNLPKKIPLLRHVLKSLTSVGGILSIMFCRIYLPKYLRIGKNVKLSPQGNILLGARKIGDNCRIHSNVTIGRAMLDDKDTLGNRNNPVIGKNVIIGPDTLIFGNVFIGEGSTILPGSIVSKNIPPHSVVSGNPARIIRKNFDNSHLLALPIHSWNITTDNLDT